jgi:hypothetical protein
MGSGRQARRGAFYYGWSLGPIANRGALDPLAFVALLEQPDHRVVHQAIGFQTAAGIEQGRL